MYRYWFKARYNISFLIVILLLPVIFIIIIIIIIIKTAKNNNGVDNRKHCITFTL